ncbi:MAG TPA: methyltransferase domain-containing protein [Acidimicrobiales bacterium]|nr:methyltransferase domain-containing protein [Acidimicrobiales bacterium]
MDPRTVDAYEARGHVWVAASRPRRDADARALARHVVARAARVDLGCGAGRYLDALGPRTVGLDAAGAMLEHCRDAIPGAVLVRADVEALPFGRHVLGGAWANMTYHHVPRVRLPMALADLHRAMAPGAAMDLQVLAGSYEGHALPGDEVGDRLFAGWEPERLVDVLVGAGFDDVEVDTHDDVVHAVARRARTLADTVGPGMRLLVVGLNPSVYAADAGVGFARPGNRFWPAALEAGLVIRDRDPVDALRCGVGMTDLVKRATPNASGLTAAEYRTGMARMERLTRWLAPGALCFVGLAGWRAARDPAAAAGLQGGTLGGRPVYVMPSTSGANAHTTLAALTAHLRAALACPSGFSGIHDDGERVR